MDILEIGEGPATVVAVHGIQGTRASWIPVAEQLAGHARWILPNLRGRGNAFRGRSPADYTLEKYAEELAAVIDRSAITGPLYLAGWSMGVSVVLACLSRADAPAVDGLLLLSGSPALDRAAWFNTVEPDALRQEVVERERRLGLREAADHDAVILTWQAISPTSQRDMLPSLHIPARILQGSLDTDSPMQQAAWLLQGLPDASLHVFDGAGHGILQPPTRSRVIEEILHVIDPNRRASEFHTAIPVSETP